MFILLMLKKKGILELVHLMAKFDPILREHLVRVKLGEKFTTSYLSSTIQNEFVAILGGQIRKKIIEQVKQEGKNRTSEGKDPRENVFGYTNQSNLCPHRR